MEEFRRYMWGGKRRNYCVNTTMSQNIVPIEQVGRYHELSVSPTHVHSPSMKYNIAPVN